MTHSTFKHSVEKCKVVIPKAPVTLSKQLLISPLAQIYYMKHCSLYFPVINLNRRFKLVLLKISSITFLKNNIPGYGYGLFCHGSEHIYSLKYRAW